MKFQTLMTIGEKQKLDAKELLDFVRQEQEQEQQRSKEEADRAREERAGATTV